MLDFLEAQPGRVNLIEDKIRPHLFINELFIYIKYLKEELLETADKMDSKKEKYFEISSNNY